MEFYDIVRGLPPSAQNCVLAIGNFDGLHHGHRHLIDRLRAMAQASGRQAAILTFEPHPRRLFRPDDPPFRLTPAPVKRRLLAAAGVDIVISLPFDWDFASRSAESFVEDILKSGIKPASVMIGPDFRFGQLRRGDPALMEEMGIDVTIIEKRTDDNGDDISSSAIRQALAEGDIDHAHKLLGWRWYIEGPVVKGDQRGRTIGYPTANVHLGETVHPAYGIYASWVQIEGENIWRPAATNIGIRPMFAVPVAQVESYIFDFDGDIYGRTLRIMPVNRLRGEARFESLEALIAQIDKDCEQTRTVLKDPPL